MKSICIFLATGFEEVEALFPLDILRRGGLSVKTVSVMGEPTVTGAHGVPVVADCLIEDLNQPENRLQPFARLRWSMESVVC